MQTPFVKSLVFGACLVLACRDDEPLAPPPPATAFEPEVCSVPGGCEDSGRKIDEPSAALEHCPTAQGAIRPTAWHRPWRSVACPLGECYLFGLQLAAAANGDMVAIASAAYETAYGPLEGGVALVRYDQNGELRAEALWDFTITPLRVAVRRSPALLMDPSGQLLYASARSTWPGDQPRALTLSAFATDNPARTLAPRFISGATRPALAAVGGEGRVLVASIHHARDPLSERVAAPPNDPQPQLALSLFERDGRARWNRVFTREGSFFSLKALHLDTRDRSTLVVRVTLSHSIETRALQLNPDGHIRWQRLVAKESDEVHASVDAAGNVYVLSRRNELQRRNIQEVEVLDADGRSLHMWEFPSHYEGMGVHPNQAQGALVSGTFAPIEGPAHLLVHDLTPTGACNTTEHEFPGPFDGDITLRVSAADGGIYFATYSMLGRLGGSGGAR